VKPPDLTDLAGLAPADITTEVGRRLGLPADRSAWTADQVRAVIAAILYVGQLAERNAQHAAAELQEIP